MKKEKTTTKTVDVSTETIQAEENFTIPPMPKPKRSNTHGIANLKSNKKESKRDYPDFDQKTDSVVTTKGYNTNVIKAHNRMKAKLATLPKVSLKPGETVKRNFIPGAIDYNKEKLFKNRKTGEFTSKLMVKKNSAKILKKK